MNHHEQIRNRNGMREIDEVGVFSEELERTPEGILRSQSREEGKERERCADGVEDAERRELMCRVDALKRCISVHKQQLVVPREECGKADDAERIEPHCVSLHPCTKSIKMKGNIAAEQEDKDVVHDPVVQPVEEQGAQERPLGQPIDVEVERGAEARPVVESNLHEKDTGKQRQCHAREQYPPERHQEVKPDQDHHEVELVLRIPEKENPRQREERREADTIGVRIVDQIEERPHEVGDDDRTPAPHEEIPIGEGRRRRLPVEQAERRDKEKNRHAEARADVKERHKMNVWRWIREVLRADVDADHAHHRDAADRLDSGDPRPLTR